MVKHSKPKRRIGAGFFWLLLLIATITFLFVMFTFSLFPKIWTLYAGIGASIILFILGKLSFRYYRNGFLKFLNLVLCFFLLVMSILLPRYQDKISNLFNNLIGNTATINVYVMNEEYKQAHPEYFESAYSSDYLEDYANGTFITTLSLDADNQVYAINEIEKELSKQINISDQKSVQNAAEILYTNQGDALIMAESFESILEDTSEYENFKNDTKIIASYTRPYAEKVKEGDASLTDQPFAIFIGGNDEWGELSIQGRTDVNIVIVVNPETAQIVMINMPRDSYISNPAFNNENDKLTHLGMNGIDNTLDGLGDLLGVSINNYVMVNFTTFQQIINDLDGVKVNNPYAFGYWDNPAIWFEEGELTLSGEDALWFVRERKTLPDGDFGRIMHQQLVMKAIIQKLTSPAVITHFDRVLDGLSGKFLTNLSSDAFYGLCRKQLTEGTNWNIVNYSLSGVVDVGVCAISPGEYLSVVYLYDNQVEFVKEVIQQLWSGEGIIQEEMPEGIMEYDN